MISGGYQINFLRQSTTAISMKRRDYALICELLDAGADITLANMQNQTSIDIAEAIGSEKIVQMLRHGREVTYQTWNQLMI